MGEINIDYRTAEQAAKSVRVKFGEKAEPYIDIFDVAERAGFRIIHFNPRRDQGRISGFSREHDIYLNVEENSVRAAFTVAHELGHHFLKHKPSDQFVHYRESYYYKDKPDIEKQADVFAAELLMPAWGIKKLKRRYDLSNNDSGILADLLGVSPKAMRYRLNFLNGRI